MLPNFYRYLTNSFLGVCVILFITYLQTILDTGNKKLMYDVLAFLYGIPLFFGVMAFIIQSDCVDRTEARENISNFSLKVIFWTLIGLSIIMVSTMLLKMSLKIWKFFLVFFSLTFLVLAIIFGYIAVCFKDGTYSTGNA